MRINMEVNSSSKINRKSKNLTMILHLIYSLKTIFFLLFSIILITVPSTFADHSLSDPVHCNTIVISDFELSSDVLYNNEFYNLSELNHRQIPKYGNYIQSHDISTDGLDSNDIQLFSEKINQSTLVIKALALKYGVEIIDDNSSVTICTNGISSSKVKIMEYDYEFPQTSTPQTSTPQTSTPQTSTPTWGAKVSIDAVEESGFSLSCVETGCYTPMIATVDVGGVVTMTNTDSTGVHTFTSGTVDGFTPNPDGIFDTGVLMAGDAFKWRPTEAGTVPYYCMLHTWMIGSIIVQEAGSKEHADEHGDDHGHSDSLSTFASFKQDSLPKFFAMKPSSFSTPKFTTSSSGYSNYVPIEPSIPNWKPAVVPKFMEPQFSQTHTEKINPPPSYNYGRDVFLSEKYPSIGNLPNPPWN